MNGIFLDIETNGLNYFTHRSLEIALRILDLTNGKEKAKYEAIVFQDKAVWEKSDLNSLKVNGFTYEIVCKGKKEALIESEIVQLFNSIDINRKNSIFICQNPSFDRLFFSQIINPDKQELLSWPYHWLDLASMYWAYSLSKSSQDNSPFPWETGFSKDKIAQNLSISPEEKPHRAMNGVNHLIQCYKELLGFPFSSDNAPKPDAFIDSNQ